MKTKEYKRGGARERIPIIWNGKYYESLNKAAVDSVLSAGSLRKFARRGFTSDDAVIAARPTPRPKRVITSDYFGTRRGLVPAKKGE